MKRPRDRIHELCSQYWLGYGFAPTLSRVSLICLSPRTERGLAKLAPLVLGLTLLGAGGVGVPEPGAFVQKHLQDSVSDVSILEVGGRGIFVYGRTTTNDPALLASFCSSAIEALEMILPGRSAHVLWHTPSSIDYKCPIPTTRRKLPPRDPEPSE